MSTGRLAKLRLSPHSVFDSSHLGVGLQSKVVRSGLSTISSQGLLFIIQMLTTVVLARLLTPTDYGLIGMVTLVLGFARIFRVSGLSTATQQRSQITVDQVSGLFWLGAMVGLALGACVVASAPLVAWFFHREELVPITMVLALTFPIDGVAIQHDALLRRHMRFGSLSLLNVLTLLCSGSVSIGLALAHWGYWSLVAGTVASAAFNALCIFALCPWVPKRPSRAEGLGSMVRFGIHVTAFDFVNYFSRNLDNILIGRFIGSEELGFYSKAYSLFMLPISQIRSPVSQVAMPMLSAIHEDRERFVRYYLRLTDMLATVMMPLTVFAFVQAEFLIRVFLGPQWMEVVPLFRVLAVAGVIQGVSSTTGLVLLSRGDSRRYLWVGVVIGSVFMAGFAIGLHWGTLGMAAAYTILNYVTLMPSLWYCFRGSGVTVPAFLRTLVTPGLLSLAAAVLTLAVENLLQTKGVAAQAAGCTVFIAAYISFSWLRPSVRDTVHRIRDRLPFIE